MTQDSRFRRFLEDVGLSYVMAVPKSQQVHGPRIGHLIGQAPSEAWQRLSCGDGAKGPRIYDWAAARLPAVWEFDGDEPTRQRWMLARRSTTKPDELAYFLASAPLQATLADLVRIAGCHWKIEECFQRPAGVLTAVLPCSLHGRPLGLDLQQSRGDGSFIAAELPRQLRQRDPLGAALGQPLFVSGLPGLVSVGVLLPLRLHGVRLGLFRFGRRTRLGHEVAGVGRELEAVELPADGLLAAPELLGQLFRALARPVVLLELGEGFGGPCLTVAGGFGRDGGRGSRGRVDGGLCGRGRSGLRGRDGSRRDELVRDRTRSDRG